MFKPVPPNLHINQMEEGILRFWRHNHIPEKTSELRNGSPEFVFYERPISARNHPNMDRVLSRVIRDMFLRFKTMCGHHVVRRGGWDTHGLPVEFKVENQLGITSKKQIKEHGIANFNELCRHSTFEYILEWERLTNRIAYWTDLDDAYITYTNDYAESVWWMLKTLWDQGLLYQAFTVVPYCPRCETPLSYHEVVQSHKKTEAPSVFFRLPLVDDSSTSLLIWTAKPWTLPGSVAVAVHPDQDYIIIERDQSEGGRERLILAKDCVDIVFNHELVDRGETFKGRKLKGLKYRPLFTFLVPDKAAHYVVLEELVSTSKGSGLVHISPAFNTQDFKVLMDHGLPILQTIAEDGTFLPEFRPWSGKFFRDAGPLILRDLETRGLLLRLETCIQSYPYCCYCSTPLLNTAREAWHLRTSQHKERLEELHQNINWRSYGKTNQSLHNQPNWGADWVLGRKRYWGIPLPVWDCKVCHHQLAVESMMQLSQLSGRDLHEFDLHRPNIDDVFIPCPKCKGQMERVEDVVDNCFDSAAMPAAQWHFPFEGEDIFRNQFPADLVCEKSDQIRGWFNSMSVLSAQLFESKACRNVINIGSNWDIEGSKLFEVPSTIIDPWEVINNHGADALRWYLYTTVSSNQDIRISTKLVAEAVRSLTLPLWNTYSFFITNARLDQWTPSSDENISFSETYKFSDLDRWLISELNLLVKNVTKAYNNLDPSGAVQALQTFIDMLSRWYLRRSRRRFWKSKNSPDKQAAYSSLYKTLVSLSKLLAPAMPLLAEELFQNLVRSVDQKAASSVHMVDWPGFNPILIDAELNHEMRFVRKLASLGHSARSQAGIRVRQPLAEATFILPGTDEKDWVENHAELLADDLNLKQVHAFSPAGEETTVEVIIDGQPYQIQLKDLKDGNLAYAGMATASKAGNLVVLNTKLTPDLIAEGLVRQVSREIQALRKQAGLEISDHIQVYFQAPALISDIIQEHRDQIMAETLAEEIHAAVPPRQAETRTTAINSEKALFGLIKAA